MIAFADSIQCMWHCFFNYILWINLMIMLMGIVTDQCSFDLEKRLMLNSKIFLDTYSDIESWLRKKAHSDRTVSFYQLVELGSKIDSSVRRYRDDLKEYADLRNAIVHERTDGRVIAEPNDIAVSHFNRIRGALLKPPTIIPKFHRKVFARDTGELVASAISDMRAGAFSQLPITNNGEVIELITSNTIVRWLAAEVKNDLVSLLETKIEVALKYVEDREHYCFLSRNATFQDAIDKFDNFASRGKILDAILITESGRGNQDLLGILTIFDLPDVLTELGLGKISLA